MTNKKKRLGLSVPKSLYDRITQRAEYQGKTLNSTCLDIFWEYFEPHKNLNPINLAEANKRNTEESKASQKEKKNHQNKRQ